MNKAKFLADAEALGKALVGDPDQSWRETVHSRWADFMDGRAAEIDAAREMIESSMFPEHARGMSESARQMRGAAADLRTGRRSLGNPLQAEVTLRTMHWA